jgi:hypothetical protein
MGSTADVVLGENGTAFLLLSMKRADLDELGLGCNRRGDMRVHLGLIVAWIGALCGIWANRKSFLLAPRRRAVGHRIASP